MGGCIGDIYIYIYIIRRCGGYIRDSAGFRALSLGFNKAYIGMMERKMQTTRGIILYGGEII